jgi:hypothetical protein
MISRRQFLSSLGALTLAPLERSEPALILYHANIITVDARNPHAEAAYLYSPRLGRVDLKEYVPPATLEHRESAPDSFTLAP